MKVIIAVGLPDIADVRFGKVMEIPTALLQKGPRILLMINGHREVVVVDEVDYYEEGVAIVFCEMQDSLYHDNSKDLDDLVTRFQEDPNWKQYGAYFETDGRIPDGPMDEEVLALLKS